MQTLKGMERKGMDCEVVIIGAGAAGLTAAVELKRAGVDVRCLEAGNRVGGRIFTVHDPLAPLPIELGAEFVHGRPPEIWDLIRSAGLTAYEHTPDALHVDHGKILKEKPAGEIAGRVLSQLAKSARQTDESLESYLHRSRHPSDVKDWARIHIEGFNAARQELISVASLAQDAEAADRIEGDRTFRILAGYDSLATELLRSIPGYRQTVKLNSVVRQVNWRRGFVEVHYESAFTRQSAKLRCRQAIVTVPLGVLQAVYPSTGAILFDPEPRGILKAAGSLQFGQVYRVTFRFSDAFWEEHEELKRAGFLVSKDKQFFTWWTTHPVITPLLTGWMAGSAADRFQASDAARIATEALDSLSRVLNQKVPRPEAAYFHNWRTDPFFRGAYSYVPVNGLPAREALAKPVEDTLFFAGEATELNGHGGTVHGAIASGVRAAELVCRKKAR